MRILGNKRAAHLSLKNIDAYRTKRLGENTKRKRPPSVATLNREVALLKRFLNYAVDCGDLDANPVARIKMLDENNVRQTMLSEADFAKLHDAADAFLRPILLVAYDTGMRKQEILNLRWRQVDLKEGIVRLAPEDTKTDEPRIIYLTGRVLAVLRQTPRSLSGFVFVNPRTDRPWADMKRSFEQARKKAGLNGVWFHDHRRSFVTNARRRGVPESVVMRMSGHKTRTVFDRYNIVSEEDLKDAVSKLEAGARRELNEDLERGASNDL